MKNNIIKISIILVSVIFSNTFFPNILLSAAMTSGSYKIERDSINFSGGNSSSATYVLDNASGEVGTGDLESASYKARAGYEQYVAVVSPSPSASSDSVGPSGGRIGSLNVFNFVATPGINFVNLSWEYPVSNNIQSVRIVRSDKFFPTHINDGEVIFEGSTNSIVDYNVVSGVYYYYAIFALDSFGRYSSGVISQAMIAPDVDQIPVSKDPFAGIPRSSLVSNIFDNLTFSDFDFIQNGIKIAHAGNTIAIDGEKELTISLDYNKVPEILKTIAVTLIDPEDDSKIFTFLLRVNENKTAYEATIGSLNRSGEYKISTIVLDYKNQSLKRLDGVMKAFVFGPIEGILNDKGIFLGVENAISISSIGFVVLLIILLSMKKLLKREHTYDV